MDNNYRNIDQRLMDAYLQTTYRVQNPALEIRIGEANDALNLLLQKHQVKSWAFITAWNPGSTLLERQENNLRHQHLVEIVEKAGYQGFIGEGIGVDCTWEPEVSLLILGISQTAAIEVGQYFGQNAIVYGTLTQVANLLLC